MRRIFVTRGIFSQSAERMKQAGYTVDFGAEWSDTFSKQDLIEQANGAEAIISFLTDSIDGEVLRALSNLSLVANVAAGYDNIDLEVAREKNITVTHVPGILTDTTADLAFGLLLAVARRIPHSERYLQEGRYEGWKLISPLLGSEVTGKTLGIIGMGRIGSAVARRGRLGFNMEVLYHSRTKKPEVEQELDATCCPLSKLLARSDYVSLHTPLTEKTAGLIGEDELKQMSSEAYLINTSRGKIVDEDALISALKEDQIAGAGLDVFQGEPAVDSRLLELQSKVVITPHIGSETREVRKTMVNTAVNDVLKVLRGDEPENPVVDTSA